MTIISYLNSDSRRIKSGGDASVERLIQSSYPTSGDEKIAVIDGAIARAKSIPALCPINLDSPALSLGQRLALEAIYQKGFAGQERYAALRNVRICLACESRRVMPGASKDGDTCAACSERREEAVRIFVKSGIMDGLTGQARTQFLRAGGICLSCECAPASIGGETCFDCSKWIELEIENERESDAEADAYFADADGCYC